MKSIINIFLFLCFPFVVSAQGSQYLDSLKNELQHASNDTLKMDIYRNMGFYLQNGKVDSALYYHQQQLAYAKKLNMKLYEADANQQIAYVHLWQIDLPTALKHYNEALKLASDPDAANIGWGYSNFSFSKSPEDARLSIIGMVHYELSTLYFTSRLYEKEKYHLREALKIGEKLGNNKILSLTTRNIADFYNLNDQPDSALNYYRKSIIYFKNSSFKTGLGHAYENIALYYESKQQYDSVNIYFKRAIRSAIATNNLISLSQVYIDFGRIFLTNQQLDSALHYTLKGIDVAKALKSEINLANGYTQLAEIYQLYDRPAFALEYLKKGKSKNDSINNAYIDKLIQFQNDGFDSQLKLKKIEEEQANFRNKLKMIGLISIIAVFILIAILLYRNNVKSRAANKLLQQQKEEIQSTLEKLESTQSQLIQSEKMASLGELTAGIAHEIQNPLNFVNNFSEVNQEMVDEAEEEIEKGNFDELKIILKDIKDNSGKINHHGKRADAIVKGMLQHSRSSSGEKELTKINVLADEYLRLAYHGLRAKDKSFNATLVTEFDESIGKVNISRQDIGRVLLNLINNAFYAVDEKKKQAGDGYQSTVAVSTKKLDPSENPLSLGEGRGEAIQITVKDNGNGIPEQVREKIFQPFFTTKPTGHGTGLGLSLSYDIIKAHGGELKVETEEGEGLPAGQTGTTFTIHLPVN